MCTRTREVGPVEGRRRRTRVSKRKFARRKRKKQPQGVVTWRGPSTGSVGGRSVERSAVSFGPRFTREWDRAKQPLFWEGGPGGAHRRNKGNHREREEPRKPGVEAEPRKNTKMTKRGVFGW
jgi:hypothetical protein